MSNYGEFEYGTGIVYGHLEFVVSSVDVLAKDLIRMNFSEDIVVNDAYKSAASYSVFQTSDPLQQLAIRRVLQPQDGSLTVRDVILHIDGHTDGVLYSAKVVGSLVGRLGGIVDPDGTTGQFFSRRTKMDTTLSIIPKHYSKRPTSEFRGVLQAIMDQDDIIGGSRNDIL